MATAKTSGDWSARNLGSGAFVISKPKRNKVKKRANKIKHVRRGR